MPRPAAALMAVALLLPAASASSAATPDDVRAESPAVDLDAAAYVATLQRLAEAARTVHVAG